MAPFRVYRQSGTSLSSAICYSCSRSHTQSRSFHHLLVEVDDVDAVGEVTPLGSGQRTSEADLVDVIGDTVVALLAPTVAALRCRLVPTRTALSRLLSQDRGHEEVSLTRDHHQPAFDFR